jgi:hypothetical protein
VTAVLEQLDPDLVTLEDSAGVKQAEPRWLSEIPEGTDIEAAHVGARLQRLPITPQGVKVAGVMEARKPEGGVRYKQVTVQIPRRSTKTTTIQNVLLGRCATRPGYQVVSTAQDGTRASQFFRDMMDLIDGHANEILELRNEELQDAWDGTGKEPEFTYKQALAELGIRTMYYSQQREYIKWKNGSKWRVAKPEASSLRGGAAHAIWFDEGGELDHETAPKLLAGALPMMDTKPEGQVIVSGTPGEARVGMFWNQLEKARANKDRLGIVDYSADEFCDPTDERVWWETHPGLTCGLTTIDVIRERFDSETGLSLPDFMREYLCIWPPDSKVTALNLTNWGITETDPLGEPPAVAWGIGWDVAIGGSAAAVAVAWYDDNDEPHVQIMDHRAGSQWVAPYVGKAVQKFPRVPLGYDSIGDNITVAQALGRMPRVKTTKVKALTLKEIGAATAAIAVAVDLMTIHHPAHSGLDTAVKNTTWRESNGSRLFMRGKGIEISCLLACVAALAVAGTAKRTTGVSVPRASLG